MIYVQKLKWSNWFSYGEDNEIDFIKTSLLQICGVNGTGKSSIPIILEETLFGKNSKGIKKADIPNRLIEGCAVSSVVYFLKDDTQYVVKLNRKGSSTKLVLIQDEEDISSHTATGTYAQISNILGLDYKLYSQLTYQSSTSSLQFLKATDTERKKFLISLFNLDEYLTLHEMFKAEHKSINTKTVYISGQAAASASVVEKFKNVDMSEKEIEKLPELDNSLIDELGEYRSSLLNIKKINEDINKNNAYIEKLALINKDLLVFEGEPPNIERGFDIQSDIKVLRADSTKYTKEIKELEVSGTEKKCNACGTVLKSAEDVKDLVDSKRLLVDDANTKAANLSVELENIKSKTTEHKKHTQAVDEFEKLSNYIDKSTAKNVLDDSEVKQLILDTEDLIATTKEDIERVSKLNSVATAHNAKLSIINDEIKEHSEILTSLSFQLEKLQEQLAILQTLKDAFGTVGLITYKLEFVVKALEEEINAYLTDLSFGRFQIVFVLVKDKLNIEIIDNGTNISISALSTGELARVNTSTVLAIRKLMSNISNTKLNLLFLDEIMGVLDAEGKDTLVDHLMKENLNTLIVSHEFQHPLVPQVLVSKDESDIASIEKVNG